MLVKRLHQLNTMIKRNNLNKLVSKTATLQVSTIESTRYSEINDVLILNLTRGSTTRRLELKESLMIEVKQTRRDGLVSVKTKLEEGILGVGEYELF